LKESVANCVYAGGMFEIYRVLAADHIRIERLQMTLEEWALKLTGRQYRDELSREEEKQAAVDGMLIVFGASDDLLEFRGEFHDEIGAYNGTKAEIDSKGLKPIWNEGDEKSFEDAKEFFERKDSPSFTVQAEWSPSDQDFSWVIRVDVANSWAGGPRYMPFIVKEDDEQYCKGLVIDFAAWCRVRAQAG
jgi:hypothetical protein